MHSPSQLAGDPHGADGHLDDPIGHALVRRDLSMSGRDSDMQVLEGDTGIPKRVPVQYLGT
jgi:hypothetical protein